MEWPVLANWIFRGVCALISLVCFGLVGMYIHAKMKTPSADLDWRQDLITLARVDISESGQININNLRDWRYNDTSTTSEAFRDVSFNIDDIADIWFMIEPLPGSTRFAHTILIFELENGEFYGLSIEARREKGETYSPFWGLWNKYELAYVWASAEDLLTRRAVMIDHELQLYKVKVTDAQKHKLLREVARTSEELWDAPRFYNTLFNNCTNEFAQAVDLPWGFAHIMTGRADKYLDKRGLIDREFARDGDDLSPKIVAGHETGKDFNETFSEFSQSGG